MFIVIPNPSVGSITIHDTARFARMRFSNAGAANLQPSEGGSTTLETPEEALCFLRQLMPSLSKEQRQLVEPVILSIEAKLDARDLEREAARAAVAAS